MSHYYVLASMYSDPNQKLLVMRAIFRLTMQFKEPELVSQFVTVFIRDAKLILSETTDCVLELLQKAKGTWVPDFLQMMMSTIRRLGEGSVLWTDDSNDDPRRASFATICSMHVQVLQLHQQKGAKFAKRVQFVTETEEVAAQGLNTDEWQRHKPLDTKSDPSIYGVEIGSRQMEISSLDVLQLTTLATRLFLHRPNTRPALLVHLIPALLQSNSTETGSQQEHRQRKQVVAVCEASLIQSYIHYWKPYIYMEISSFLLHDILVCLV